MESREFSQSRETNETKRGGNVTIRNFWQRHAQKMSGEVFNAGKTGISTSAISPAGADRAKALGRTIEARGMGAKGYKSASPRTQETFEAEMEGYMEVNPGVPVRETVRMREQLVAPGNKEFVAIYDKYWSANKAKLLAERGLSPDDFKTLSPDDQELIAETAEEPVIQEWIDKPESDLAEAFNPRIAASSFAVLFNRRHERMAEKLNNGSEIDLFHNTHKTATEAFLASGVLIRKSDQKRITKIKDLGGSLRILDNWESIVKTNDSGHPEVEVIVRGENFNIDSEALQSLVAEGLQQKKITRKNERMEKLLQDSIKRSDLQSMRARLPDNLSDRDFVLMIEVIMTGVSGQKYHFSSRPLTPDEQARGQELAQMADLVGTFNIDIDDALAKLENPTDDEVGDYFNYLFDRHKIIKE